MHAISLPNVDLPSMPGPSEVARGAGEKGAEALRRWRTQAMRRAQTQHQIRPWIASGVFTIALIGAVFALLTWSRRAGSDSPGSDAPREKVPSTAPDPADRLDVFDHFDDDLP
jgi:hypothetical protein